jgi:hypothetical protein
MPRIFDNIEQSLLPALQQTIQVAYRADFCVGYFNLRGWGKLASYIDHWPGGDGQCCRLLVGMQSAPDDELRTALRLTASTQMDNAQANRLRKQKAQEFRDQLVVGAPSAADEAALQRLAAHISAKKLCVKLFLGHHSNRSLAAT